MWETVEKAGFSSANIMWYVCLSATLSRCDTVNVAFVPILVSLLAITFCTLYFRPGPFLTTSGVTPRYQVPFTVGGLS